MHWFDGGTQNNQWYRVVLSEGRNREVRRMWSALGYQLSRLTRVRYGPVDLPAWLRAGKVMDIEEDLLTHLHEVAGVSVSQDAAPLRLELDSARRGRATGGKASKYRSGPASRNRRPGRR